MTTIRKPAVAGLFYPDSPEVLRKMLNVMLDNASVTDITPRALIAPHAGYVYSGDVAACAYKPLALMKKKFHRVVLLGPTHCVAVKGCALSSASYFRTPLGDVSVDTDAVQKILSKPNVQLNNLAHEAEHSLEVHLPFLQTVLDDFSLVPIAVGHIDAAAVMDILDLFWNDSTTLIVVSSDLSHFHDYMEAQRIDKITTEAIEQLKPDFISSEMACGVYPVNGLLKLANKYQLRCKTLALKNSGDTAGDKSRVVGYGAYAFF